MESWGAHLDVGGFGACGKTHFIMVTGVSPPPHFFAVSMMACEGIIDESSLDGAAKISIMIGSQHNRLHEHRKR